MDVRCAIEAIRSAEVSIVHTFEDAKAYIKAVDRPGIGHINGDLYHMLVEESHIGQAILDAGEMLNQSAPGGYQPLCPGRWVYGYRHRHPRAVLDRLQQRPVLCYARAARPRRASVPGTEQHPRPCQAEKAGGGYRALLPRTRRGIAGLTQRKSP